MSIASDPGRAPYEPLPRYQGLHYSRARSFNDQRKAQTYTPRAIGATRVYTHYACFRYFSNERTAQTYKPLAVADIRVWIYATPVVAI